MPYRIGTECECAHAKHTDLGSGGRAIDLSTI